MKYRRRKSEMNKKELNKSGIEKSLSGRLTFQWNLNLVAASYALHTHRNSFNSTKTELAMELRNNIFKYARAHLNAHAV